MAYVCVRWLVFALLAASVSAVDHGCAPEGKMYKVTVTAYDIADPITQLKVVEAPIPDPGPGEVLMHMRMRPVDPADFFSMMGYASCMCQYMWLNECECVPTAQQF